MTETACEKLSRSTGNLKEKGGDIKEWSVTVFQLLAWVIEWDYMERLINLVIALRIFCHHVRFCCKLRTKFFKTETNKKSVAVDKLVHYLNRKRNSFQIDF